MPDPAMQIFGREQALIGQAPVFAQLAEHEGSFAIVCLRFACANKQPGWRFRLCSLWRSACILGAHSAILSSCIFGSRFLDCGLDSTPENVIMFTGKLAALVQFEQKPGIVIERDGKGPAVPWSAA